MGVFCDRLKLYSTAALDCRTGQNKSRYRKKELSFLLVSLYKPIWLFSGFRIRESDLQANSIRYIVDGTDFSTYSLIS